MDWIAAKGKITAVGKKYRYPLLLLLVGIILIVLPTKDTVQKNETTPGISDGYTNMLSMETQLAEILSTVAGAGKVKVMLTVSSGEETIYQTDTNESHTSDSDSEKKDTVIVTDASRNESGLVRQIMPPKYLGAVVVCQGADSPVVRLSVVEAVAKLTGLGTDRITVLKMK